jgi:hypothetical protein
MYPHQVLNTRSEFIVDDSCVFRIEFRGVLLLEIKAAAVVFGRAVYAAVYMSTLAFRAS